MIELKSCAHCGAPGKIKHGKTVMVSCTECSVSTFQVLDDKDSAITAWNRRATPPSPSTARDQDAVREGVEPAETRMDTGFQPLYEGGPNSPSAAQKTDVHPIASDSIRSAPIIADSNSVEFGRIKLPSTVPIAEDERAAFWRSGMGRMWRAARCSARPAGEVEEHPKTSKNVQTAEVELPPLPEETAWFDDGTIFYKFSQPTSAVDFYTADQLRAYGQECARAALASTRKDDRIVSLLREARATLEMWKDVAPAVSLCADIDSALASKPAAQAAKEKGQTNVG